MPEVRGLEALKQPVVAQRGAYPDGRFTERESIAEGGKVVTRRTFTGTYQGEWIGIPPAGKREETTGTTTLRIAQGKVPEFWVHWDTLGSMQRLGAITNPAVLATNKAVVRRYAGNLHSVNNAVAYEFVTGDVVMHSPHTPAITNRAEFEEYVTRSDAAFSGIRYTTWDLMAEGDRAALRFTFTGSHTSEWKGMAPTGKAIEVSGAATYRLRAGKIAETWIDWDALGVVHQHDAVPRLTQTTTQTAG